MLRNRTKSSSQYRRLPGAACIQADLDGCHRPGVATPCRTANRERLAGFGRNDLRKLFGAFADQNRRAIEHSGARAVIGYTTPVNWMASGPSTWAALLVPTSLPDQ